MFVVGSSCFIFLGCFVPKALTPGNSVPEGAGPIWMDEVNCLGNETRLDQCRFLNWGEHDAWQIVIPLEDGKCKSDLQVFKYAFFWSNLMLNF